MTIYRILRYALAAAAAAGLPAHAADAGDAAAGAQKVAACKGCHGIDGYKSVYPAVYHVPRLGGQHPAYIAKALQEYKAGNRKHPTMRAIASGLSDKDMADIGAYYGTEAPKTAAK